MKNSRAVPLAGMIIVLAAVAAYWNSLQGPFLFDDAAAIVGNRTIRHLWPPGEALSPPSDGSGVTGRPIVNLSLALNFALGGLDVRGYHATNLTLHVLAALTLWGVLRRTLRNPVLPARVVADADLVAACAALLWTVHPLLTESVTCVVQRNEVMAGLFYLLTLYGFIRATADESAGADRGLDRTARSRPDEKASPSGATPCGGRVWLSLAVAACLAGMACKEIMATAPVLVLLYDRTFVAGDFRRAWGRRKFFYGALAATWLLLAWLMLHSRQRGGTVGFGLGVSSWEYLLTQCRALTIYLKLSIWPHPLLIDYGSAVVRSAGEVWAQGLFILALLAGTVAALRRKPALGVVGAWFFVILAPSSSVVPLVSQTIAEHRMYLPLAAVIVLAVVGGFMLAGRGAAWVCLAVAAGLAIVTFERNQDYRDDLTVWNQVLEVLPGNARAESGLGTAYFLRGDLDQSIRHYRMSLQLDPASAQVNFNLGLALQQDARGGEAVAYFARAVELAPTFAAAQAELGAGLVKQRKTAEALQHLRLALAEDPGQAETYNSLGMALAQAGQIPPAVEAYEKALRISPGLAHVHFNLGLMLAAAGRRPEALAQYAEAVLLDPRHAEARVNLGVLLAQLGRGDEALVQLREAVRLRPDWAEAHANLGIALAYTGHPDEAVTSFEEALRLRPDYAVAHYNLGNALLLLRRPEEARRHFAEAVRLDPGFTAAREMLERMAVAPKPP